MIDSCFSVSPSLPVADTIVDSLVVGQLIEEGTDERVVLFIQLGEGFSLTEELKKRIKTEIRARRTARHVPEKVSCDTWSPRM